MEPKRTHCEKFIKDKDGKISVVDKVKYATLEEAQEAADKQNILLTRTEKIYPYQCRVCKQFHVGRNGDRLTQDDVDEIWERIKPVEYRAPELKVIGKVDIKEIEEREKKRIAISKNKKNSLDGRQRTIDNSYDKGVHPKNTTSEMLKLHSVIDGRTRVAWVIKSLSGIDVDKTVEDYEYGDIFIMPMYPDLDSDEAKKRMEYLGEFAEHVASEVLVYRKDYKKQAEAVRDELIRRGGTIKPDTPETDIALFRMLGYSKGFIKEFIEVNYPYFDLTDYKRDNPRRVFLSSVNGPNEEIERLRKQYEKAEEEIN